MLFSVFRVSVKVAENVPVPLKKFAVPDYETQPSPHSRLGMLLECQGSILKHPIESFFKRRIEPLPL